MHKAAWNKFKKVNRQMATKKIKEKSCRDSSFPSDRIPMGRNI